MGAPEKETIINGEILNSGSFILVKVVLMSPRSQQVNHVGDTQIQSPLHSMTMKYKFS